MAQHMAGLESVSVRVMAHGLGHDRDTGEVLRLLEQAQRPLGVDPPGDRDCLVWRAVEAQKGPGGPGRPTQMRCPQSWTNGIPSSATTRPMRSRPPSLAASRTARSTVTETAEVLPANGFRVASRIRPRIAG